MQSFVMIPPIVLNTIQDQMKLSMEPHLLSEEEAALDPVEAHRDPVPSRGARLWRLLRSGLAGVHTASSPKGAR